MASIGAQVWYRLKEVAYAMLSLTVIISIKKRYDALSEALKSIARQTVKPQEIIVVDQTPNNNGAG